MATQVILVGILAGGPAEDEPGEPHAEQAYGPFSHAECVDFRDHREWTRVRMYPLVGTRG